MKDFSHWKEYEGASEGSGRSEKLWLINPDTNQTGLFKLIESVFSRIAVNTGSMVSSSAQSSSTANSPVSSYFENQIRKRTVGKRCC